MRVLLTGATGFLGYWVSLALVNAGHSVRAFVRNRERASRLQDPIELVQGDVLDRDSLARAMLDMNTVIHCAACLSLRPRDHEQVYRTNVLGTKNVLDTALAAGLNVIHTSSIASIGPTRQPQLLDESAPDTRLSFHYPYAESKRRAEQVALSYAKRGHPVSVLNPGIMLGPGDVYLSSTEFVMRYLRGQLGVHLSGGGSFCDVRDVAIAYVTALSRARAGERYILAGINKPYADVLHELQQMTDLHRSLPLPAALAEFAALWSELNAAVWPHPFEPYNLAVFRWGSLYNYCSANKAASELGYVNRDFTKTLEDTLSCHILRGTVRPTTAKLKALFDAARARHT